MKPLFFSSNLKTLRKNTGLSQAQFIENVGIKRTTWNGYETGNSYPNLSDFIKIADYFRVSTEDLLHKDLSDVHLIRTGSDEKFGTDVHLNVHPSVHPTGNLQAVPGGLDSNLRMPQVITLDTSGDENVVMVPFKARAGYLNGYSDPQFMATLPAYRLPGLNNGTFRIFEVHGISMYPTLHDRDLAIGSFVENLAAIRNDRVYVVVTKNDGIVIKRVINRVEADNKLILNSDNYKDRDMFPPIICNPEEVLEIWYVTGYMSRQLRPPAEMYTRLIDVEARLTLLERGHRKVEE